MTSMWCRLWCRYRYRYKYHIDDLDVVPLVVLRAQLDARRAREPRRGAEGAAAVLDARVAVQLLEEEVRLRDGELEAAAERHEEQRADHRLRVRDEHVGRRHLQRGEQPHL